MTDPGEPRLRTLQVDAGREWRGGQRQVRLLLRELRERPDAEPVLATRAGSRLAREGRELGVPVVELPWRTGLDPRGAVRLAALVSERGPIGPLDVVHAHDSHALQTAWVAAAAVGSRAALVATRRVLFPPAGPALWRRPELVLAVSGAVRERLLGAGLGPARVRVVHDALDPRAIAAEGPGSASAREGREGRIRPAAGVPAGAALVGAVGALERGKGHDVLVRAAVPVLRAGDAHFIVLGEGTERAALERRVADAGIGDRFHLPGHLPDAALSLGELDLFVMPSTEEGFGSAALEAMAAGVPVVLARAGGLRDLAGDELPTVPPGDPEALASAILRLLRSEDARREAAEAGRRRLRVFRPGRMVEATLAAYREVLVSRRRRWATAEWETRLEPLRRARAGLRRRAGDGRAGAAARDGSAASDRPAARDGPAAQKAGEAGS